MRIVGIDLAKQVFHVCGMNKAGKVVLRKKLQRQDLLSFIANIQADMIVMESCGGANYWSREFTKLGHTVKLIAPQFVKPFVKSNKNDVIDAEAICEAGLRPRMRFTVPKNESQQDIQNLHRIRTRLVKSRTALVNEMRGLAGEYGIVLPKGIRVFKNRFLDTLNENGSLLSSLCYNTFLGLWSEFETLNNRILEYERELKQISKSSVCQRLMSVPGVGYLTATALIAATGDPRPFKNGRQFAAWLGLVPKQYSTGGRNVLQGISKRGNSYIRKLLIHGARVTLRYVGTKKDKRSVWATNLRHRKGMNLTSVALANKNARTLWCILVGKDSYRTFAVA